MTSNVENSSLPFSDGAGMNSSPTSFLARVLERLSSTQFVQLRTEEECPVAVVALQRYLSVESERPQPQCYDYDVTVCDGQWKAKCFLHPSLNHLVLTNTLRTGVDVTITECSFVFNEMRLGFNDGYICIEKLRCSAERSTLLHGVSDVRSLTMPGTGGSVVLHSDVPLQVRRKHYLPLWNDNDPEGDIWSSASPPSVTVLDVSKITLISNLEDHFRSQRRYFPLLVKIIHKSRLRYYGKFGLKIDYPYQAYFEVADQSGIVSLVLWNELCPEFYQGLKVGTVLYIQNYTLKQSYSKRSYPQMAHYGKMAFNSVEICLNPRNPAAVITVVPPNIVQPQWGLPDVSYQFITRSELNTEANNRAFDVIGLVTFVGRVERVRSKGSSEKFWTYRWVHAVDGTSNHPFILEIFSSSQPDIFNSICPMTYLVCTQMRICQVEGSLPYLTSSCETQIFITGYHKGQPYVSNPTVKSFIQWTKTLKDSAVLKKTAVGGNYCYPHPPRMFTQALVDDSDLKKEFETLQYREHKRMAIQGEIVAIQYIKTPKNIDGTQDEVPRSALTCISTINTLLLRSNCLGSTYGLFTWKSHSWPRQQEELCEHLCQGDLYQDSFIQTFSTNAKNGLLMWSNLQPTRWSPEQTADTIPSLVCQGYYHITILGEEMRFLVMVQIYFSCFAEEIIATSGDLDGTHVVCILDLCHLGGDKVEVVLNKLYTVTEISPI
uniref:RPA-related protein RADX n=1 Tax=Cynoglossus semilaevis TaxID=244447 RepID=A0A3P8W5V0_CYNSE